jgi:hypothetical protein
VPVKQDALFIADRFAERLPEGDADVFHRVVSIDVQVSLGFDIKIYLAMPGNLIQHMLEEREAGIEGALTGAVEA